MPTYLACHPECRHQLLTSSAEMLLRLLCGQSTCTALAAQRG